MCAINPKRTLLTGIAVLFLATGTIAEAGRSYENYHCGKQVIEYVFQKYFAPERGDCVDGPCDGKGHYFVAKRDGDSFNPRVDRDIRMRGDVLFYKGRKCRAFTEDEYHME
jgi:hypothetical protein